MASCIDIYNPTIQLKPISLTVFSYALMLYISMDFRSIREYTTFITFISLERPLGDWGWRRGDWGGIYKI